jgi:transcription initiation factor TFIID subunit TAF12
MQLMQAADSISSVSTDSMASDSTTHTTQQQPLQQQQQQQQQQLPVEQERFTVATLRKLLQSLGCMATLRRMGSASVEELAGEADGPGGVRRSRQPGSVRRIAGQRIANIMQQSAVLTGSEWQRVLHSVWGWGQCIMPSSGGCGT